MKLISKIFIFMLTCCVVEGDSISRDIIVDYISMHNGLQLLGNFDDPFQALTYFNKIEHIDILFLDIEMPGMTGIELAKTIYHKIGAIIFTTAHVKYSYDAFELSAAGFLLKPFSYQKFGYTIDRLELVKKITPIEKPLLKDYFFIKDSRNRKINQISLKNIIFYESFGHSVRIHCTNETIQSYISLSQLLNNIGDQQYLIQVHRSYVISLDFIKSIEANHIIMVTGERIPIGRSFKNAFLCRIRDIY